MTEHGVAGKLLEFDKYRRDNRDLSSDKARRGAERLAAALTLCKSTTLRAPGCEPDPELAVGALDPAEVLVEWTDAERNALLRRGVFAPSTYGRIRFHHRNTQEYLTAFWIHRLLRGGCPLTVVWTLLFAEKYGIKTLVPSLHASAAWLAALEHADFREEIVEREPLVLMRHGDPRSLPAPTKKRLLAEYAKRHLVGEISDNLFQNSELSFFATPELSDTIQQAWRMNAREDFRIHLLVLVREGAVRHCAHLARTVLLDEESSDLLRIVALEALHACEDTQGMSDTALWFKGIGEQTKSRLGPDFAKVLFPRYLTVDELLDLIGSSPKVRRGAPRSFGHVIYDLWKACSDATARERLIDGLADLCLAKPFKSSHRRVSDSHSGLAENLDLIARESVLSLGTAEASEGLIRLLMAVERASRHTSQTEEPSLSSLVSANSNLQCRLFLADVKETRQKTNYEIEHWTHQALQSFVGDPLWRLGSDDEKWLVKDLSERSNEAERRIALSAILWILRDTDRLHAEAPNLRPLISDSTELLENLQSALAPVKVTQQEHRWRREEQRRQSAEAEEERKAKKSWIKFREELLEDPSLLSDETRVAGGSSGAFRLYNLHRWLCRKTTGNDAEASLQWRSLEEGFDQTVAEAYRDGMKALWRATLPERPKRDGNNVTYKRINYLALLGIGIEAAEDPDWALRLSPAQAERATLHGCLSEQGYLEWIDQLIQQHRAVALPIVQNTLHREWQGCDGGRCEFFSYYSTPARNIHPCVQEILFEIIAAEQPESIDILDRGLHVLERLELSEVQRKRLDTLAHHRIRALPGMNGDPWAQRYFAMLLLADPDGATKKLTDWIDGAPAASRNAHAENFLGTVFGQLGGVAELALGRASVPSLESIIRLFWEYVRPEDDREYDGVREWDARATAERARGMVLQTLLDRPGIDAYQALRTLAEDRAFRKHAMRLKELAHRKAELDAETPAWRPQEVLAFEQRQIAPAKTGEALLRIVISVLDDIKDGFRGADATSRAVLERARDENEVQEWLVEQLNLRSQGRFHTHREVEVARGRQPDVIVSSTAAMIEVAIEIKHGENRSWTLKKLERSLTEQLVENYLKPETRRWGILMVLHCGRRTWRDPTTHTKLSFCEVIQRLNARATELVRNDFGPVEVRTFGMDASPDKS